MRKWMYTISRLCLTGLLLAGTALSVPAQGPGGSTVMGFPQGTMDRLQQVLTSFVTNPDNPYVGGLSVAIKIDELAFWQGAAGYAARNIDERFLPIEGGIPFTAQTPSQIYSVTKTFTAALVLELVQEGVLDLDARVSAYLPLDSINPELADVTLHQLLAHESGYSDFWLEPALQLQIAMYPYLPVSPYTALGYVHQIAEPGKPRSYSSSNYIMLGAIIERVTHTSVASHFRQRFFEPLDLNSMYLRGREDPPAGSGALAAPHDNLGALGLPLPNTVTNISILPFTAIASLAFTSGGIVSTVADMAEWGSALFGGRATSKEVLKAMLKSIDSEPDEDGDYLGYGLWKSTQISDNETFIGHDGNAIGYRSVLFYQPEKRLTLAILTNDRGARLYDVAKALYQVLLEDIYCGNTVKDEDKMLLCHKGKVQCVDYAAAVTLTQNGAVLGTCGVGAAQQVQQEASDAGGLTFLRAHPNPVSSRGVFSFRLEQTGMASLRLYDVDGRLVSTLFKGVVEKGVVQQVVLERASLPAGIYFGRLQTASGITQRKVVLSR